MSDEMPKGFLARAYWAAENTPAKRNRAVDFYRALAIFFVILGHWLLVAPVMRGGEVDVTLLLAEQRWTHYATWLFQVMPVFFFVGGFGNSLSWDSARKDPTKARHWAAGRLARLLKPTVPLVVLWGIAAVIATLMGVDSGLIGAASQAALVPVWFLAVYIMITVAVPLTMRLWDAMGVGSVVVLVLAAICVDAIGIGLGQGWLRWINYAFVWLAVHQLGYWWRHTARPKTWALGFVALGVTWLYLLIVQFGFPVAMVSAPGDEFSNTRPPTTAMLAIGFTQIGVILLVSDAISRWLQNTRPWAWVIVFNQMIMSIYLWHITAMVAVVGIAVLLGGIGLGVEPGSGAWWAWRPLWLGLYVLALIPFTLIFLRFEAGSRAKGTAPPGPVQALLGAGVTCAGLIMIALSGIGAQNALGVNWLAVLLVVGGVVLATRHVSALSK